MRYSSFTSSYTSITAGARFSSCCCCILLSSSFTSWPFCCIAFNILMFFSIRLWFLYGHVRSGKDSLHRLLKVEGGIPIFNAAFICFILRRSLGMRSFLFPALRPKLSPSVSGRCVWYFHSMLLCWSALAPGGAVLLIAAGS